ncbi:MAG: SPFH domain-containing protein [Pseudomonadota bacterium]
MNTEKVVKVSSGYVMLVGLAVAQLLGVLTFIFAVEASSDLWKIPAVLLNIGILLLWFGLFMVNPNQAKVLQLFGSYVGTARDPGLRWANPFYSKKAVSVKVRNFESGKLKVNESSGSPIEIAAVVVWRVVDTAEAVFEVDDFEEFVNIQSEAALRNLATSYPYESDKEDETSLRSHPAKISESLRKEIQDRLEKAGVEVIEARISHLAYAPEIANAMLRRQQASAIIAARERIVEGAVGMVELALSELSRQEIVDLDEERKATMVSNLLVVLCSEDNAQPVLNTGTLY